MGKHPGNQGGHPRRDGKPAGSVPKPVYVHEEGKEITTGVTRDPETGQLVCAYTEPQKAQAVAAYSVTNSAAQAVKVLEGLWGLGCQVPGDQAIRTWAKEGVRPDETALDSIRKFYEARRVFISFGSYEKAHTAFMERELKDDKLFNLMGAVKLAGEDLAVALQRPQQSTTYNMPGAMFIRKDNSKPVPEWDIQAKVIDGNGDD